MIFEATIIKIEGECGFIIPKEIVYKMNLKESEPITFTILDNKVKT